MPSLLGSKPNQVSTNGELGTLAFQDSNAVNIQGGVATVNSLTNTGVTTVQAGTVSAPAITTTGDTNTGIFFPAADTIAFTEGGVESMRINSAGQVGIGTSSPSSYASNGNNLVIYEAGNAGITIATGTTNEGALYFADGTVGNETARGAVFYNHTSDFMGLATAGSERMRIDSSGRLGIGTSSPSQVLDIVTSTGNSYIRNSNGTIETLTGVSSGLTAGATGSVSNHPYVFFTNNTERMRVDSSGNLLVGITSARANAGDVQVSKGISFPATQSAQSDANTLDDYEEGTWTPVLSDGTNNATMDAGAVGVYTKVGRIVTINCTVHTSSLGSVSGNLRVNGLPFIAGSLITPFAVFSSANQQLNITSGQYVSGRIIGTLNYIQLWLTDSAAGMTEMTATEWSADGYANFSASYFTS